MKNIIKLSNTAIKRFQEISKQTKNNNFLFSLKGGGCNGFEYKIEPLNDLDKIKEKNNEIHIQEDINIYICNKSLMYLFGTEIDWKKDIMGETFVFDNPNSKSTCGCGTSFTPYIKD